MEIGPGETTDALAAWFGERWNRCPTDPPIMDMIRRYTEDWKRNPPDPNFRKFVSGAVSRRSDLLDDAHRPLTIGEYRQALKKCEEMLQDKEKEWEVLNPLGRSYMRAISERRQLLLGEARWSQLDSNSQFQLKGGEPRTDSSWWGLLGRMARSNRKAVWDHEAKIRPILDKVVSADDTEFPDVAVAALQELTSIDYVAHGTATLLLTLARPDRLLSLNGASEKAYGKAIWDEPFDPRRASKLSQAAPMALRPALVCRLTADGWSIGKNLAVPRCSRGCVRLRTDVAASGARVAQGARRGRSAPSSPARRYGSAAPVQTHRCDRRRVACRQDHECRAIPGVRQRTVSRKAGPRSNMAKRHAARRSVVVENRPFARTDRPPPTGQACGNGEHEGRVVYVKLCKSRVMAEDKTANLSRLLLAVVVRSGDIL